MPANPKFQIPDGYHVTRDGRVFSTKRSRAIEMQQFLNGSGYGYPAVWLRRADDSRWHVAVYRLVAHVYLPPRPSLEHVIMHFPDPDRMNSHADNLKWGTASENYQHAYAGFWERRSDEDQRREFGVPVSKSYRPPRHF